MAKYFAILSLIILNLSCNNSKIKDAKQKDPNEITDFLDYRYSIVRENARKSNQEIYRSLIVWSWGVNHYGGGVVIVSIGKEKYDTSYFVRVREFGKSKQDTSIVPYGNGTDITRRLDSLKFVNFRNHITKISSDVYPEPEIFGSDTHTFSFEGFPNDTSVIQSSSNYKFPTLLAIEFLKIANYDKRAIKVLEKECEPYKRR